MFEHEDFCRPSTFDEYRMAVELFHYLGIQVNEGPESFDRGCYNRYPILYWDGDCDELSATRDEPHGKEYTVSEFIEAPKSNRDSLSVKRLEQNGGRELKHTFK
jgi:hypothetical protein